MTKPVFEPSSLCETYNHPISPASSPFKPYFPTALPQSTSSLCYIAPAALNQRRRVVIVGLHSLSPFPTYLPTVLSFFLPISYYRVLSLHCCLLVDLRSRAAHLPSASSPSCRRSNSNSRLFVYRKPPHTGQPPGTCSPLVRAPAMSCSSSSSSSPPPPRPSSSLPLPSFMLLRQERCWQDKL